MHVAINEQKQIRLKVGELVISFAKIEHHLDDLLEVLTEDDANENIWIRLFFIDNLMLGRALEIISWVAKVRLQDYPDLHEELKDTLANIRPIQKERNNIVHGNWLFDPERRTPTKVRTYRLRWKAGCWQYLDDTTMTPTKLNRLIGKSDQLVKTIEALTEKIKTSLNNSGS